METKTPNEQLNMLLSYYLTNNVPTNSNYPEFEARFGTRRDFKKITKIDYDNVITELQRRGFTTSYANNKARLDIRTQFKSDVGVRDSSIRVELHGMPLIQEYCRTDQLDSMMTTANLRKIKFIQKQPILDLKQEPLRDAEFSDFDFTVSFKNERSYHPKSDLVIGMIKDWQSMKKTFRFINRIEFTSPEFSKISVHMTVVKSSTVSVNSVGKREPVYSYNIADSNVFTNEPTYEIEFELINKTITQGTDTPATLTSMIHKVSKFILCGLQNTNFPIPNREKEFILNDYSELLYPGEKRKMNPSYFIGPSSVTLQAANLSKDASINSSEPSVIRGAFCVTDKADGDRHLLFISSNGKIYLISTNMDIIFTGIQTTDSKYFQTILDGELIKIDKNGEFINRYASFDIYFLKGKDIRNQPFMLTDPKQKTRLQILNLVVGGLVPELFRGVGSSHVSIMVKTFLSSNDMFADCRTVLTESAGYEYNVDGLIFTHKTFGVGANSQDSAGPLRLTTWKHSFKWKPSEYNTIDFLVQIKRDSANNEIVTPTFIDQVASFHKTLILQCGYSEKDHGYLNPVIDVIDKLRERTKAEDASDEDKKYKPVQFVPTNPSNYSAGICHLTMKSDGQTLNLMTEDNDIVEDDTIVEFRFDKNKYDNDVPIQQCWIPIRNRYDKTAKYRQYNNIFGNAYHTANSNWHSIHNPITREMLSGQEPVQTEQVSADIYYNGSTKKSHTERLRQFHNMFVKKTLISCVSKEGDTLIDYGCGKGGDIPKWTSKKLSFVLGIDYSKDNIENRTDGIYARYLNHSKRFAIMPKALFVNGDCSKNIRDGSAIEDDMYKEVIRSVFGQSEKDRFKTHMGIYDAYGIGADGFQVSSCQFAMHYFFKSVETLHGFMRNVSECTSTNGYFIGTCYDGQVLMHELRRYMFNEGLRVYDNQHLMCEIIKKYDSEEFSEDETCLGKQIMVYQDSINQYLPEYLVNFRYLTKIANLYGFELLSKLECKQLNLPMSQSDGMFQTMFVSMRNSPSSEYNEAIQMSESEKYISFLNRYFVFKKVTNVNAESVYNSFINPSQIEPILMGKSEVEELKEKIGPVDVMQLPSKIILKSMEDVVGEEEGKEMQVQQEQIIQLPKTKKIKDISQTKPQTKKVEKEKEAVAIEVVEPVKPKRIAKKAVIEEPTQELITDFPLTKKKKATTKKMVAIVEEPKQIIIEQSAPIAEEVTKEVEEPVKKKRIAKKAINIEEEQVKAPSKTRKSKKDKEPEP